MDVIPVLDIQNGVVVHAVAGDRQRYAKVRSTLTDSCDPSVLLRRFQELGFNEVYVADLDAILRKNLNRCTLAELSRCSSNLIADCGIYSAEAASEIADLEFPVSVIALETLPSLDLIPTVIERLGESSAIFSLDLIDGQVSATNAPDLASEPLAIVQRVVDYGINDFIVLDLRTVGTENGPGSLELCRQIRNIPNVRRLITGGGFRQLRHFAAAVEAGVDGVLVASGLHNGQLDESMLDRISALK